MIKHFCLLEKGNSKNTYENFLIEFMSLQTRAITFLFFIIFIMWLYISLNHWPKATHNYENIVKSLTVKIFLS